MNEIYDLINKIDCLLDNICDEEGAEIRRTLVVLEEKIDELNNSKQTALQKLNDIYKIVS